MTFNYTATAKDMVEECKGANESGYFILSMYEAPDGGYAMLRACAIKEQDELDGHKYYAVHWLIEVDDNTVGQPDYEYTEHLRADELRKVLCALARAYPEDKLKTIFEQQISGIEPTL